MFAENNLNLLVSHDEVSDLKIPNMDDIYGSESESSEDDDETKDNLESIERRALKRSQKQQWYKKRADILWEYYEKSWYSIPVCCHSFILLKLNLTEWN